MKQPLHNFFRRISLIVLMVRRDYAVQYAGTSLGILWLLIQYLFQIAIFYLIFGMVLPERAAGRLPAGSDYFSFLLGGMTLWLPLSEMLVRSCGILYENRSLIRRTSIGMDLFLWIPVFQAFFHYMILYVPVAILLYLRGTLSFRAPLALLLGFVVFLSFSGWSFIISRISILLKDISPVVRLLLQVVFWGTPIIYRIPDHLLPYMAFHPLYGIMELHRDLLLSGEAFPDVSLLLPGFLILAGVSLPLYYLSSRRLSLVVVDHL